MTDEFEQAVRRAAQGLDGAGPSAGQAPTYHDAWERGRRRKFRKQAGMAFAGALVLVAALTLNFGDLGRNSVELDVALPTEASAPEASAPEATAPQPQFLATTAPVTAPTVSVAIETVPTVTAPTVTVPAESVPTEAGTVAPATVPVVPVPPDPVAPAATATAIPTAPPQTVVAPTAEPVAPTATATPPPTFTQQQPAPTEVPTAAATETGPAPSSDPGTAAPTQDSTDPTSGQSATSPGVAGLPDIELIGPEQQPDAIILPSFAGGTVLACVLDGEGAAGATCTLLPRYSCAASADARPGYLAVDLDGDGEFDTCVAPNTTACDSTGDGFADTPCTIELLPEDS